MTFAAETITDTLVAMGPILFGFDSDTVGRVVDFQIETKRGTYEHMGGGNLQQIVTIIETQRGTGRIKLTLDEICDIDASTVQGRQTNAWLRQAYPEDATKMMEYAAPKAHCNVVEVKGVRNGQPTTITLEVTPYNTVGTAPWTWSHAATA